MQLGPAAFLLRMEGPSMEPRFLDGDYQYVDPDEPAEPGRHVAVGGDDAEAATVRRCWSRGADGGSCAP